MNAYGWPKNVIFSESDFSDFFDFYNLTVSVPCPDNITIKDMFVTGEGIQRPRISMVGCGDSPEQAEKDAYEQYVKITNCDHKWISLADDDSDISGDCFCEKCRICVYDLQMDEKLRNARNLAYEAHEGQFRKYKKIPYIDHPEEVYFLVASWGFPLSKEQRLLMAKAAYLHDVIEDCPHISKERFISEVDEETYCLVQELTNPSKNVKAPRAVRKKMDRDHLASVSWEAKIIKLFDRTVNLKDVSDCLDKNFVALYAEESRLLLECLKGTNENLENNLLQRIIEAETISKNDS